VRHVKLNATQAKRVKAAERRLAKTPSATHTNLVLGNARHVMTRSRAVMPVKAYTVPAARPTAVDAARTASPWASTSSTAKSPAKG
jgi:hypothetical protein